LGAGEQKDFVLNISVLDEIREGPYSLDISVECLEITASKEFIINVLKEKLELSIINAERVKKDKVKVSYSLEELYGENQNVELYFSLLNSAGQEVSNASANRSIDANLTKEFKIYLPINESLEGNLTLSATFDSEIYSSFAQEPIILGSPIVSFTIFEGVGVGNIVLLVVVVLFLIILFIIVRKIKKNYKIVKKKSKKSKVK
jgi:hypothetical protein